MQGQCQRCHSWYDVGMQFSFCPHGWFKNYYVSGNDLAKSSETAVRKFPSGATRDVDTNKLDYEGFLSPLVLKRFAEYMHLHRIQKDGSLRDAANWQRGIPKEAYMKSMFRHFMDAWSLHRGNPISEGDMETALCAVIFNAQGYLYEILKAKKNA